MYVVVNGEARELPAEITIAQLVLQLGLADRRVAVEVNRDIVPRSEHATRRLADGDRVEVVAAIGGG
jgi:sulfur carrier protein